MLSSVKDFLLQHWLAALVALLLLVIAGVALYLWLRRRRAAPPKLAERLESAWKPYFAALPGDVAELPAAIVFGEAGAGKTHLIEQCVDFAAVEANRFLPTARDNPLVQFYAGSSVLAQEISWALLNDVSPDAEKALERMWQRLGPGQVVVVVALSAPSLRDTPAEALADMAQRLRGKLAILSQRLRRTIELRVCVTFMDQVEGYASSAHVGFRGPLLPDETDGGASYKQSLAPLEDYLPWTLVSRSNAEFRALVSFLSGTPALLERVDAFARELTELPRPGYEPQELCLSAYRQEDRLGEPFAIDPVTYDAAVRRERRSYLLRATVAAALACAVAGLVTLWHYRRLVAAESAVAELSTASNDADSWPRAWRALDALDDSSRLWLRYCFTNRKSVAKERFVAHTRRVQLLPRLGSGDKTTRVYAAAVLCAEPGKELANTLSATAAGEQIEGKIVLPHGIVAAYLRHVDERLVASLNVDQTLLAPGKTPKAERADWATLFRTLDGDYQAKIITVEQLGELAASPALASLTWEKADNELVARIVAAARTDGVDGRLDRWRRDPQTSPWVIENYDALVDLAATVHGTVVSPPPADGFSLIELMDTLAAIAGEPAGPKGSWAFVLDGRAYEFSKSNWTLFAKRGRSQQWIDAFSNRHDADLALMFFKKNDDEVFRPQGAMVGTRQGATKTLDGFFTKDAFDNRLAPVLPTFKDKIAAAAILDKTFIESLVQAGVSAYSRRYREALTSYYDSYQFAARSTADVQYEVGQIAATGAWFTSFLRTVSGNAALDAQKNPYLQEVCDAVSAFQPIVNVMEEQKGVYPKLQKYSAILVGAAQGAGAGAKKSDGGLATKLSPVGATALGALGGGSTTLAQVAAWTAEAGVFGSLATPFDRPAERIDALGRDEIAAVIAGSWTRDLKPSIAVVIDRFPFTRKSKAAADPEDVEALLGVKGSFWDAFALAMSPVVSETDGRWSIARDIGAPAGMLKTVNALSKMRAMLWDAKGNRQAIKFRVAPTLLPQGEYDGATATMAYLKVGDGASYAFNQLPSERTIAVEWWKQTPSALVVEFTSAGTRRRERSLESFALTWSFHRLLTLASATAGTEVTWRIPLTDKGTPSKDVAFSIAPNPWTPFTIQ